MKFLFQLGLLLLAIGCNTHAQHVEEFIAHGPMDFHNLAMNKFMEIRRKDPSVNLSHDGEFLKQGNKHAIRRMRRKPEEELSYQVHIRFTCYDMK
jgi:hypothetical protein